MFNSILTKLTLWYAGVLAFLVIAFAVLTYFSVARILTQETDENLLEMSKTFTSLVIAEGAGEDEGVSENDAITEVIKDFRFKDFQIFVFSRKDELIAKTSDDDFSSDFPDNAYTTFQLDNRTFRVFSTPLNIVSSDHKLLISHNLAEQSEIKNRLLKIFLTLIPLILLAAILLGYFLAKRSLRPITEMSRQAKMISANNLNSRLSVKNERDEIGSLAVVFNELLERLENSFETQRRFMADASHELRTPLAIVRGESEVALAKENRSHEELRESLAIVSDESGRLTKIVEDLFTLSRADAGQFKTNFKQIYLDEILSDCLRNVRVLAEKKSLSVNFSAEETIISGDEQLLRRMFLNLFDNAVKYNRKDGEISVNLTDNTVTISDTGIGIAADERTKIFERFYRTDKSRTRGEEPNTSGAGLGLSIAGWIAELHQAELKLSESDESGSTFIVIFPR
jgi:heavy metal sensor kinase